MIDWEKLARERNFLKGEVGDPKAMLVGLYEKVKSVEGLSEELNVSRHTVRVALEKFGVTVHKRGGARPFKFEVTDELLDEIESNGAVAVARRLDVDYTTIYKRTKDALRKRREQRGATPQSATEPEGEKGTPRRVENQ